MVAIFKTNVKHPAAAMNVISQLLYVYPAFRISLDLEDEDKILRVEGNSFHVEDVILSLLGSGFICIHLPYDPDCPV
ncbi:methyltransferase type 11 [Pedobacter foliorum]|uniref:methyltransferase type 11 n=1 Tax=Pedobacter foliorum TaxID=2739058 RepID=UPI001566CA02|nr:methyltransferase type 11 [Pedobacter foliorum]NRF37518.1 methyltransferase type 11 [Pedobacter foliorum]